jgi:hypothetical protein
LGDDVVRRYQQSEFRRPRIIPSARVQGLAPTLAAAMAVIVREAS